MAYAKKKDAVLEIATVVVQPEGFELNLSMQEATTLMAVLAAVGGSPDGRRGDCDAIAEALMEHGLEYVCGDPDKRGSITLEK